MAREAQELTNQETAFIAGYVRFDAVRYQAVLMRHFGRRPLREVERATGLPRNSIDRLVKDFGQVYQRWVLNNQSPAAA